MSRSITLVGILALGAVVAACGGEEAKDASPATADAVATQASASASPTTPTSTTATRSTTSTPGITPGATHTPTAVATQTATTARQTTPAAATTPSPTAAAATVPPQPPAAGAIAAISLASAGIEASSPIEVGDTVFNDGVEYFEDPGAPSNIIWYPRFGQPGNPAGNTIMAGHVNYVGHGDGPFANLLDAAIDDALYVTLSAGGTLAYTVKSVTLYRLSEIDMEAVVFPPLDSHTERITLISCGGTFIPAASGYGGEYDSRIVLVAERAVN